MNPTVTSSAEQVKRNFLANLRHELRTPLNAIIGYSEMILEDAEDAPPAVLGPLQQIRTNGSTLLNLVNTLLDASKIANGAAEIPVAELSAEMDAPLEEVLAQANALLDAAPVLGIGNYLDDLQKIREAGVRLRKELNDAKQRNDSSQPRKERASGMLDHVDFMRPHAPAVSRPDAAAGRILVVDDNDMNRDVLQRRLQTDRHQVALAASGAEALALVAVQPFDLILLDILMPEMSGMQVLQRLKEDPHLRHIPVVMISALDEMDSIVRSIDMGAEDYLPKPFEPSLLRARVGACLEKKRLRDREVEHLQMIEAERNRADGLLRVILPERIIDELKSTNEVKPRRYENVAIMFSDIVGFTPYCDKRQPEEIVANLQELVVAFEKFAIEHRILKIKTIGDSFMAACGLLDPVPNPVLECVRCGVRMIEKAQQLPANWVVRIGIHCGSVVAGVLGHHQYLFDLWGDTVNTAARMESHGVPVAITLSEQAHQAVAEFCRCDSLGVAAIKGKGELQRYVFRAML